jgi:hypothetical protein
MQKQKCDLDLYVNFLTASQIFSGLVKQVAQNPWLMIQSALASAAKQPNCCSSKADSGE